MYKQKTFPQITTGGLYLVATPIGNLADMTYRAVSTLQQVDYILAEDTRVTQKLCRHYGIDKKIVSCHEHNQYERCAEIVADIKAGQQLALVSDAGMPCISDPGAVIVQALIAAAMPISVIPGVSASSMLYAASGMSVQGQFLFHGFLPTKEQAKMQVLARYATATVPVIFYESPHRIAKTLALLPEIFTPETKLCLGRELTKVHETFIWCTIGELHNLDTKTLDTWKGELAFIIEPVLETLEYTDEMLYQQIQMAVQQGIMPKQAMQQVSAQTNIKKNVLYQIWETHKEKV